MQDKISIIVPAYNAGKFISRCIESILIQTYSNIEVIIIDDGSNDNTFELCNNWACKDKRIRVYKINNCGPANARNIGIKEATGEWLLFVDADDSICSTMCADLLYAAKENSAEMSFCNLVNRGLKRDDFFLPFKGEKRIFENKEKKKLEWYLVSKNSETGDIILCLSGPICKLIKRECIKDIAFPIDITLGEDTCFVLEVINRVNKVVYINKCLYNRYITDGSLSSLKWNDGARRVKYVNWVIDRYYDSEYFKSAVKQLIALNLKDEIMIYYKHLSERNINGFKKAKKYLKEYKKSNHVMIGLIDIFKACLPIKQRAILVLEHFNLNLLLFIILKIRNRK